MILIVLILSICIIASIILFRGKPNLFVFRLIENVFGKMKVAEDADKDADKKEG
jgi:hypothetical protein